MRVPGGLPVRSGGTTLNQKVQTRAKKRLTSLNGLGFSLEHTLNVCMVSRRRNPHPHVSVYVVVGKRYNRKSLLLDEVIV